MEKPIEFSTSVDEQSGREVASLWKDELMSLLHGRDEHNKLILTCSPLVKEEDGSDLIPNWCRVQSALVRLVAERNEAIRRLKEFVEAWSDEAGYSNVFHEDADKARSFLVRVGEKAEQQ